MKKRVQRSAKILVGTGIVLVAALSVFLFLWNEQKKITDFVVSNRTELESIALSCLNGDKTTDEYKGVKVDGVYSGEHRIVQFYYSGLGLAPSAKYYGFYYSGDNVPAAFQNAEVELVPASADEWTWEDGTDNCGLTKRITDGWFYYEASF